MLGLLKNQTDQQRISASAQIIEHVLDTKEYVAAKTLMCYVPITGEVDTAALIRRATEEGKIVVTPHMEGDRIVPVLHTTSEETAVSQLDLVLVPGLAFSPNGQRLGRGGGHFDRFLPTVPAGAVTIGLAFGFQVTDEIPAEAHDVVVGRVVTEAGFLD